MQWFDDIAIGTVTELGSHHFSAEEIVRFARAYDPQPFHVSEEAGKASLFGGLAASGWHTTAIWQSLLTAQEKAEQAALTGSGSAVPPDVLMPSVSDLRWLRPTIAGDTLTFRQIVKDKTLSETVPGWGVVISRSEGFNQRGDLVFQLTARRFAKLKA